MGQRVDIQTVNNRIRSDKSEVGRLIACNKQASDLLSWRPNIEFEQGLNLTIEWIKNNRDKYLSQINKHRVSGNIGADVTHRVG